MTTPTQRDKIALIVEWRDQLDVAVANNKMDDLKTILMKLKNDIVVNEELIRETRIGLKVGKLRSSDNKEVSSLAKGLVKKWKELVEAGKGSGGKTNTPKPARKDSTISVTSSGARPPPPASPKLQTSTGSPSPAPGPSHTNGTNGTETGKSYKLANGQSRTSALDGINTQVYGDPKRDGPLNLIYNALASDSDAPPSVVLEKATAVEAALQSAHPDKKQYTTKARSLYMNLKDPKNPQLRADVMSGAIQPAKLVVMRPQEMASKELKEENEKIQSQNLFNAQGATLNEATTDMFQCKRCRQWKTTYYQMQTRSADEPMTTFVTCTNCGNRWKF
ncbi:transcription elongation factor [Atractiella rhizophila]|nr:transcription elongation factor [Atractiella rhizophila]